MTGGPLPHSRMESLEDAVPSWPGVEPRLGGELVLLLDEDPLADGHAVLLHLVARALKQGHRVCCLAAAASQAHYTAVLRKLGIDRARLDDGAAFAYLPSLPPLTGSKAVDTKGLLQEVVEFALAGDDSGGNGGGVVVVIDDLSLLAGVQGNRAAVELVQACRAWARSSGGGRKASLVVRAMDGGGGGHHPGDWGAGLSDEEEEWALPPVPLLLRQADALVEVRPLTSGYSRDVHGLITVRAAPGAAPEVANFKVVEGGLKCGRISRRTR